MDPFISAAEWLGFVGVMGSGWCLYRRLQVRRYRRAKREALAAAEWAVKGQVANSKRRVAHEARRMAANLDNQPRNH